ncbi:MAG: DEAD/DEAH box helicase, partial [Chloroflexi bacterium]|nr:DEAD/DEAH box helicase [Chloroflexota bacterium]
MQLLLDKIRLLPQYQHLLKQIQAGKSQPGLGLPRAARLPVLAALQADLNQPVLLITDRSDHALSMFDELGFWTKSPRYLFGEPNPLFYEQAAWGVTTRRERLQTLTALAAYHLPFAQKPESPLVIVTSARSLMTRTLPRRDFLKACKKIAVNQTAQPDALLRSWAKMGYQRANTVLELGQFSSRGGILDLWPTAENLPVRLDFFGDEIESLRRFDPASQRTVEKLESVLVTPAREFIARDSGIGNLELDEGTSPDSQISDIEFSEFQIPLLHRQPASLLDYLPPKTLVLIDDLSVVDGMVSEIEEQAVKLRQESIEEGTLTPDFPVPYLTWSELLDSLHGYQSERLQDLWLESGEQDEEKSLAFIEASLSEGFILRDQSLFSIHLITDSEIFGWERPQPRTRQRQIAETPESVYADLQAGDYIVHIDHGIGRFVGLVTRELDDHAREFLAVEYEGGGQLYVSVHQADRLTRYVGADGVVPALDRLGGQEWREKKGRVKEAVLEVAQEMLDLYARRNIVKGYAFKADTQWQKELEDSFPYVETDDQAKSIVDIKHDMESARPMDRLLCGDVGYGKTEVALRAAFKAVMDGHQVALLVPTTILAQQHLTTFAQRLAPYPVTVEMLSRFRSRVEQQAIVERLAEGRIDIIIGTHRLLQKDVKFKNLGLLIIDEEQRFGVTHKEYLKQMRTEVDVLTLTATPIPRTLAMSLEGLRDFSVIATAPQRRLSIKT